MSTAALQPLPPQAAYTDEPIFRLTVDQYHELIQSGKLTDNDPVELLEGILVYKMPKKTAHATGIRMCRRAIEPLLPPGWFYDSEQPLTLSDGEPEPDGMIVRGGIEDYSAVHPNAKDVALVIEIADTSIERDRGIKLRSYARASVAVYWIVSLIDHQVEVYSEPDSSPTYRRREIFSSETVPLVIDGVQHRVPINSLLPLQA